jgi:hypothetical protein
VDNLGVVPVPAGATNLPLGSTSPGNLIYGVSDSVTLAPGVYVAANINVNYPGSISIFAAGSRGHLGDRHPQPRRRRARELQPFDFASVAGSAFPDGTIRRSPTLAWSLRSAGESQPTTPNDYRGLYAVVIPDLYGLGQTSSISTPNWTTVSGTVLGLGNCATATFPKGTMVHTDVQAGTCARRPAIRR